MKNALVFVITLATLNLGKAQTSNFSPSHQFGFDVGNLFARFLNVSGTGNPSISTYHLTFRKLKHDRNTRLGLGIRMNVQGDGNDSVQSAGIVSLRVGSERFQDFGKRIGSTSRWRAFYGIDGKAAVHFNSTNESNSNDAVQLYTGLAPLFGLQFRINERLSLSTELAYNFLLHYHDTEYSNSRFGFSTQFNAPKALFLTYDF